MTAGSFSKMAEKDGRNFRAFYYDTLGLRNVELKKALEILLKDDPIDVERIATFSSRFGLPAIYRIHVWKVILGVIPPYRDAHQFVMEQRTEHFNDLKHTLTIMKKTTDEDELPFQLSTMYLLDQGALRFVKVPQRLGRKAEAMRAVVQAKLIQHYLQTEDVYLHKHLLNIGAFQVFPISRWIESGFAEDIPDSCMERIWDKVVAGSSKILAFVAGSLLLVFRHQLLAEKTSEGVRIFLNKPVPEDNFVTIVSKAMELWDKHGTTVISDTPTVH
ncbi:TBC1 domain family member 7-like isoform X2 [Acropora muricata]|uniref:TBC1 domain family member 7-like isoform X2 n=1 Tax=Acropora muricata TaxID=159855 RepID=UPI0034E5284B